MKKRFNGFTLVECIIAMAILGIASLIVAQIYAAVSTRNKMNHLVNSSLSNQMAYVEKYTNSEALTVHYGNLVEADGVTKKEDPKASSTHETPIKSPAATYNDYYITVKRSDAPATNTYSFPVDINILYSRTRDDNQINKSQSDVDGGDYGNSAGYGESQYNLRYKYIIGH